MAINPDQIAYLDIEATYHGPEMMECIALVGRTYDVKEIIKRRGGHWFPDGKFWYLDADTDPERVDTIVDELNAANESSKPIMPQKEHIPADIYRIPEGWRITVIGIMHELLGPDRWLGDDSVIWSTQLVGDDITAERLKTELGDDDVLVTYNGRIEPDNVRNSTGFDLPVIRAKTGADLEADGGLHCVDLCPVCWHYSWEGREVDPRGKDHMKGGLKKIAQTLGLGSFDRYGSVGDGAESVAVYEQYELEQDPELFKQYCYYNLIDLEVLRDLTHWLVARGYDWWNG